MREDLLNLLVCPTCKGTLALEVKEEDGGEIVAGSLRCQECSESYPIQDSIPNLLPSNLRSI